ncbi:hypothetical protein, partial [Bradyrhizobium elkanii]|uniref:hypothetical protein n=1 Tax=Bradyrhizobium elkanii TaxID=29448 RepID=UPI001AEE8BCB
LRLFENSAITSSIISISESLSLTRRGIHMDSRSKASTGGIRSGRGARKLLVERSNVTALMRTGRSCDSIFCDDHSRFAP